ncbi:MAG TPA: hypothetical protein VG347_10380 [Verrucomicrobiae bacterium]|nr:hypothetical protein [Verrucomicrobiae bacterium]
MAVKLAMAINPMIGEEETQRQHEGGIRRAREERAKSRIRFCHQLAASVRKTFVFLFGTAAIVYLAMNGGRLQGFTGQLTQRISAKINNHSNLEQGALKHEDEVDQVIK